MKTTILILLILGLGINAKSLEERKSEEEKAFKLLGRIIHHVGNFVYGFSHVFGDDQQDNGKFYGHYAEDNGKHWYDTGDQ
uniref:Clavanin-D n=1 Tax=Styela clava TaxID=7725 RepID=CLAVD_STYCL|nr:clavanin-D [Styela clava]P80713.1 RecName: Full=Clavanin-D; Flags: Precursor [Styela clava]CAA71426.1 clavanin D protein [Styela clava]CAA71901.1 Clavanin C [Styela clava]